MTRRHRKTSLAPERCRQSEQRLREMYAALLAAYGTRKWWPAETAFEVILGAFLTQATAWRSVERSIENLRQAGLLTVAGIRDVSEEALREIIRPSGFILRKAASIKAFVRFLDVRYGGSLEEMARQPTANLRVELLALPGVGPETADAILLYALGHPVFVVDEYLRRVATRHELLPANASYADLQALGDGAIASITREETARHANELHALIVEVGKCHCGTTPRCEGCPLRSFLPGRDSKPLY
ncbi:MAG: endonuclease III domain-containing protein [Acidobacteriaceae bacterium]